jgi:hypothetical protein
MVLMQTSKTFTTPGGRKVATRAHKLYAVVRDDGAVATVTLRTDNLVTAENFMRRSRATIRPGSCITVHLFRKSDGALIG